LESLGERFLQTVINRRRVLDGHRFLVQDHALFGENLSEHGHVEFLPHSMRYDSHARSLPHLTWLFL
jgi:hypothetical protein